MYTDVFVNVHIFRNMCMDTYIYTSYIDTLLKGVLRIIFLLNGVFSVIK